MARVTATVTLAFNRFAEIADALQPEADAISRKTAFAIQADYANTARRDTGAMVNSAYVATANESTYPAAVAAARGANPEVALLPEVEARPGEALVAVGAAYAAYNEYGVHGRPGDGALTSAAERQRAAFEAALGQLLERSATQ